MHNKLKGFAESDSSRRRSRATPSRRTVSGKVSEFASDISAFLVYLKVDAAGSLYYMTRGDETHDAATTTGKVFKIQVTTNQAPAFIQQPSPKGVALGQAATFTAVASGSATLNYQWQRNGEDVPGATATTYTVSGATRYMLPSSRTTKCTASPVRPKPTSTIVSFPPAPIRIRRLPRLASPRKNCASRSETSESANSRSRPRAARTGPRSA